MYFLHRNLSWRKILSIEGPSLGVSLVISELFYKFHSFTLECIAFLGTWFALSYLLSLATGLIFAREQPGPGRRPTNG